MMTVNAGPTGRHRVLVLLLCGVIPIAPAPPDMCSKAPFQGVLPTEREWSLLAQVSDQFRARIWKSDGWLYFRHPVMTASNLRALGAEGWESGRFVDSDSLTLQWDDIERLDCNRGSYAGRGVLLGAAVGTALFVGLIRESWLASFSIPAAMVIGGVIGQTQPIWRAVYCAVPHPENGGRTP